MRAVIAYTLVWFSLVLSFHLKHFQFSPQVDPYKCNHFCFKSFQDNHKILHQFFKYLVWLLHCGGFTSSMHPILFLSLLLENNILMNNNAPCCAIEILIQCIYVLCVFACTSISGNWLPWLRQSFYFIRSYHSPSIRNLPYGFRFECILVFNYKVI